MVQREVQLEGPHKKPEKRWFAHNGRLNEYERTVGCFAISTNMPLSAKEAFEHYKQRNCIEVGFHAFGDGNRDRLRTSVCGYRGKLPCDLPAQAFVMGIRKNARHNPAAEGGLASLPHDDASQPRDRAHFSAQADGSLARASAEASATGLSERLFQNQNPATASVTGF